jgi:hypothetical protein
MEFGPDGKICSFCGVIGTSRTKFAGGLGALICTDCVDKYHAILSSPSTRRKLERPWWDVMSDEEMLETLPKIARTAEQVDDFMHEWVQVLRSRKLSYNDIGRVLGVSRQAVWERFSRPLKEAPVDQAKSANGSS